MSKSIDWTRYPLVPVVNSPSGLGVSTRHRRSIGDVRGALAKGQGGCGRPVPYFALGILPPGFVGLWRAPPAPPLIDRQSCSVPHGEGAKHLVPVLVR